MRRRSVSWRGLSAALLLCVGLVLTAWGSWIPAKAALAQVLLQQAWRDTLAEGGQHRPWPWADHWPIARLRVSRLGIDQIVLRGDSGHVLAFAPGHNPASGRPGYGGTVVISGHRDTHFRFLKNLEPGDIVELETIDANAEYRIIDSAVGNVNNEHIWVSPGDDRLVLVTCYPFDDPVAGGPWRYLVTAILIES